MAQDAKSEKFLASQQLSSTRFKVLQAVTAIAGDE